MRIILHAGTPKTGTTSLQLYCHTHREALLDRGILYPREGIAPPPEPKHQWMIGALMHGDVDGFACRIDAALSEARPDTHTVLLSSEGLFHRWWDFPPASRDALAALAARYPLACWVFFREPVAFARSFYIQTLKNPRGLGPCYGEDMSLEEMLAVPRFAVHFDYIGYVRDVETVLGEGAVRPFRYSGNSIAEVLAALGIDDLDPAGSRENRTMGAFGVALLRQVNRHPLDGAGKAEAVRLIEQLDRLVGGPDHPLQVDSPAIARIEALSRDTMSAFYDRYGVKLV